LNPKARGADGEELAGKKALVIGGGEIGTRIQARLYGFGVETRYYDPYIPEEYEELFHTLREGLEWCDYAFLACPLTPENKHLIGYQEFLRLKGKVLINIARAELVDPYYLGLFANPLRNPGLVRIGWDFAEELNATNWREWEALLHASARGNAVLTKHNAWRTREAKERRERAVREAKKVVKK